MELIINSKVVEPCDKFKKNSTNEIVTFVRVVIGSFGMNRINVTFNETVNGQSFLCTESQEQFLINYTRV